MLLKTALEKEGKWTAAEITGALLQGKVWRYIPDKVTLVSKVTAVMLDYKDVVDSQNQLPLLSAQVWEQFSGILQLSRKAYCQVSQIDLLFVITSLLGNHACQHESGILNY